jgi:hypothetical protein
MFYSLKALCPFFHISFSIKVHPEFTIYEEVVHSFQYGEAWNKSSKEVMLLLYFWRIRVSNLGIDTD